MAKRGRKKKFVEFDAYTFLKLTMEGVGMRTSKTCDKTFHSEAGWSEGLIKEVFRRHPELEQDYLLLKSIGAKTLRGCETQSPDFAKRLPNFEVINLDKAIRLKDDFYKIKSKKNSRKKRGRVGVENEKIATKKEDATLIRKGERGENKEPVEIDNTEVFKERERETSTDFDFEDIPRAKIRNRSKFKEAERKISDTSEDGFEEADGLLLEDLF